MDPKKKTNFGKARPVCVIDSMERINLVLTMPASYCINSFFSQCIIEHKLSLKHFKEQRWGESVQS